MDTVAAQAKLKPQQPIKLGLALSNVSEPTNTPRQTLNSIFSFSAIFYRIELKFCIVTFKVKSNKCRVKNSDPAVLQYSIQRVESPNPKQPASQPSPWIELKFCMIIFYVERIMCRVKTVTLGHCSMPCSAAAIGLPSHA